MVESAPTVIIPTPEYFCNLAVFPAPSNINDAPKFFLMKNKAEVPIHQIGSLKAKLFPGSVYCLLPSKGKNCGSITVYKTKPTFLDSYTYCLEINAKCVEFLHCETHQPKPFPDSSYHEKCSGCLISHFPSPNTSLCRWNKRKSNSWTLLKSSMKGYLLAHWVPGAGAKK